MTADLSGIRSLLAGITPGPWAHYGDLTHEVYPADAHEDDEPANIASEVPRLADAAFIAAAPSTVARLLGIVERVEKVRQELFDISNDDGWTAEHRAAYRDASRAINTAITGEGE